MTELETIEGEVVEEMTTALELRGEAPVTLFRSEDPVEIVAKATAVATTLKDVLMKQKLTTKIGKGEHVRVEGWTLLGTMLGVYPVCVWTKPLKDGWEARVEARTRDGAVVGAAEAECLRSESHWAGRDDYALRSMAQTRATSKALRQPLGFVVTLAGFDPTPAEEMPSEGSRRQQRGGRAGEGQGGYIQDVSSARDSGLRVPIPKSWKELKTSYVAQYGELSWKDFEAFGSQAKEYLAADPDLDDRDYLWRATVRAYGNLTDVVDPARFPGPSRAEMTEAWMKGLDMDEPLAGPEWPMGPEEAKEASSGEEQGDDSSEDPYARGL